ncbi:MAG: hypothetical protein H6735_12395 [Alphaproteobacteria bacterium]|nr:hypothetical protein [Alphaproteobacteria bacterium]
MTVHLLTEQSLPGLDAARLRALADAGMLTVEQLVNAGPERLSGLLGFDTKTCRALVRLAAGSLEPTMVIPFATPSDEPGSVSATRGLDAARRIERSLGIVRQALASTGHKPAKKGWRKNHRRARKQLSRLADALATLQQGLLQDGLTHSAEDHLRTELDALERRLLATLDLQHDHDFYRRLRKVARRARKRL